MLSIQTHEVSSENTPILTAIVISNIRHILDITNITCRYKDFFNFYPPLNTKTMSYIIAFAY